MAADDIVPSVRPKLTALRHGTSWWREILLIAALYGAYEVIRGIGDVDVPAAFANGRAIMHLEHVWHVAPERVLNAALEHVTFVAVVAAYFYSVMHYIVTPSVLVWMYRKHRAEYGKARTALAISTVLGLVGFLLVPTAPPRMIGSTGLRDTLADTQSWGWWGGEGSVPRGFGAVTNQFAAMPSLHVGWSIWCGVLVAIYAKRRWVKALGIMYPLVTSVVVMATGNHYLLDAIAGAVTMGVGALVTLAITRRSPGAIDLPAKPKQLEGLLVMRALGAARAAAAAAAAADTADPASTQVRSFTQRHVHVAAEAVDPELCRSRR
jgi:hypothetical protein